MIKHVSLAVISLLFVALVSGCGDSKPTNTGDSPVTQKEDASSAKQAPGVDEKTEKKMRSAIYMVKAGVDILRVDKNIQPKTLDEIYNDGMSPDLQKGFKQATDLGIKLEYLLLTDQNRYGENHYVITVFSPDGKYKIVVDESQDDDWNINDKTAVPLEKVE